jgi:hypothetical protein
MELNVLLKRKTLFAACFLEIIWKAWDALLKTLKDHNLLKRERLKVKIYQKRKKRIVKLKKTSSNRLIL